MQLGCKQTFIHLGGTDESILGLFKLKGQNYRLDQETGIVFVDGENVKFNVAKEKT